MREKKRGESGNKNKLKIVQWEFRKKIREGERQLQEEDGGTAAPEQSRHKFREP